MVLIGGVREREKSRILWGCWHAPLVTNGAIFQEGKIGGKLKSRALL